MSTKDLSPDKLYLVALSGGADSVALALMMKEQGLRIHALHCNFHLRGEESNRDEAFVRQFALQQSIPLDVCHFDTATSARKHNVSIEMEAREQRYTWFGKMAIQLGAEAVCVAHHKDDQAETLLLNLIRGTGLRGLSAMRPDRTIKGLRIFRPLLGLSKDEILSYLESRQQCYVTDSTNLERDALRNRIRLDIIPILRELNPNITDCLARTACNVSLELDATSDEPHYYKWLAPLGFTRQQILDIYAHRPKNGKSEIKHSGLTWYSSTHILLLDRGEWILKEKHETEDVPLPHLVVECLPTGTVLMREDFLDKQKAYVDLESIKGTLALRRVMSGDRFRPFGMLHGTKLVSDYLTDRKTNLFDKQRQLVVVDSGNENIVWLVGKEIDHRYRITSETKKIFCLSLSKD